MTDRVQTVAMMAAEWAARGAAIPLAVRDAIATYQEAERQVAAAYPAPTSKELPKCTCLVENDDQATTSWSDCHRHGA